MSISSAPDKVILGRVAGALAVDEAFVEKDWFVVLAIKHLGEFASDYFTPVFSGGTSLLKAYGLIKRFSEDIDFKLLLANSFLAQSGNKRRKLLGGLRDALSDNWTAAGFRVTNVEARDANGFLRFELGYPTSLEPHESLRPHILAEISAKPPRLTVRHRPLSSFVAQYQQKPPEVASIGCVDPVETAADKLSAFTWRMLSRDRNQEGDDPTIVRHLHDLAALASASMAHADFPKLLRTVLNEDGGRGGDAVSDLRPAERLSAMRDRLTADPLYPEEYARFVGGMAFAGISEIPDFNAAVAAVDRLCARLQP